MTEQKTILLVDDEPSIRIISSALLRRAGYETVVAADGFEALQKIREKIPDLVITDLRMPNMNGFELLAVLRSQFPHVPAIAISGEFLAHDLNIAPLADAFFQKGSYTPPDLHKKIAELLEAPPKRGNGTNTGTVWAPTGDAPVMLTCTKCLRTFPIQPCGTGGLEKTTVCIFCGAELQFELVAIGVTQSKQ
ncbi:MAG TPA: response regulator [Terriglobales bacterium]|nr:response regulator [Terriglobales bacterium]